MAIVKRVDSELDLWKPDNGDLIFQVLKNNGFFKDNSFSEDGLKIIDQTHKILQVTVNPNKESKNNIGLVLGYVQSGKTLSFTSLIAMAIDNGFKLIVVFSGIKNSLNDQTFERLYKDLNASHNKNKFVIRQDFDNRESFKNLYNEWSDNDIDKSNKRSLIVVLKKNKSIEKLIKSFGKLDLSNIPSIIIDDEADQASLDTLESKKYREGIESGTGKFSTTHKLINSLRNRLLFNSYLQYTATPQSLALLNNNNLLSPNFLKIITPGLGYTGGKTYFLERKKDLIKEIPLNEISALKEIKPKCPESLHEAMRHFYIAATINEIDELGIPNLTMMVHPAVGQQAHLLFVRYVIDFKNAIYKSLNGSESSIKKNIIRDFEAAFNSCKETYKSNVEFDDNFIKILKKTINRTSVTELNTREGASEAIDYELVKNHIVVGGNILDRGLTIDGLIVSHMIRNPSKQVDTNMQRARFFGYKKKYIDLCRVWIDKQTISFFTNAVKDEEANRSMLKDYSEKNIKLDSSKMQLILDKLQLPTRKNVIYGPLKRSVFSKDWYTLDRPHNSNILENKIQFEKFYKLMSHEFTEDNKYSFEGETQHLFSNIQASEVVNFLSKLEYYDNQDELDGVLSLIDKIKAPSFEIQVVLMSSEMANDKIDQSVRKRTIRKNGTINQYFQGRNPKDETLPERYPGDRAVKDKKLITIQIHKFLIDNNECYGLAFSIPQEFSYDTIGHK